MLTNITTIDQAAYNKMLAFNIEQGSNLFIIGPAGVGKTEMAIQAAAEMDYEVGYLNLSVLESPDMTGLPMIDKETRITTYASPEFLPLKEHNKDKKPIVLLADELDKALPELQNPCLELFQYRKMNGRDLNVHAVIATGNRPDENANSNSVSHALTNRCKVYQMEVAFEPWLNWATTHGLNSLITMFLDKNKDFLLRPAAKDDPTAYVHPTPRSWSYAAKDLDVLMKGGADIDLQQIVIAGWVGEEAAVKFRVWLEHYSVLQPQIDAWLKQGEYPTTESPDQVMVCCVAGLNEIASICRRTPLSEEEKNRKQKDLAITVERVCGYLDNITEDFLVGAMRASLQKELIKANDLKRFASFTKMFRKIRNAWTEHNIDPRL